MPLLAPCLHLIITDHQTKIIPIELSNERLHSAENIMQRDGICYIIDYKQPEITNCGAENKLNIFEYKL
jgi:hypothetical protein